MRRNQVNDLRGEIGFDWHLMIFVLNSHLTMAFKVLCAGGGMFGTDYLIDRKKLNYAFYINGRPITA